MRARHVAFFFLGAAACAEVPGSPIEEVGTVEFALTVDQAATAGCSTKSVEGLSKQVVAQADCLAPGSFKEVPKRPNMTYGSAVLAYMEAPARDALLKVVDANKNTGITINSMLRSVAQQYLLYRWYVNGQCSIGLAAKPGTSNHETGLAIDVQNYDVWKPLLSGNGFSWFGAGDPVHFDFNGAGAVSQATVGVKAFQQLWNLNHADDLIAEDGAYGPQTEARLKQSPAEGFAIGPKPLCGMTGAGGAGGTGGMGGAGGDSSLNLPASLGASFSDATDRFVDGPSKDVFDLQEGRSYDLVVSVTNTGDSPIDSLDVEVTLPASLLSNGSKKATVTVAALAPGKLKTASLKVDAVAYSVLDVAPQEIALVTPTASATLKVDVYSERRWEFDGERLEGWTSPQLLAVTSTSEMGATATDGELVLSGSAPDLVAASPPLDISTTGLGALTLLARRSGDSEGTAILYLDETAIELALPADGDLHEVTIPEAQLPAKVTLVRFVPFAGGTAKSTNAAIAHLRIGDPPGVPGAGTGAGCGCMLGPNPTDRAALALLPLGAALALWRRRRVTA